MTDKELLELAAKAAGIEGENNEHGFRLKLCRPNGNWYWNPLTDDGDALRLAVKLRMDIDAYRDTTWVGAVVEELGDEPYAATRRAIVRAAAGIGKSMP